MTTKEKQLDLTRVLEDLDRVTTVTEASLVVSKYAREIHPSTTTGFDTQPPTPERCEQKVLYHDTMAGWYRGQLHQQTA
jgi:hypothetical protein